MSKYVESISATSVYGRYDFEMNFGPGINIVHGVNGSGKTTLLHILANILNGEYYRFVFLPFNSITVKLDRGKPINILRNFYGDEIYLFVRIGEERILRLPIDETQELLKSRRVLSKDISPRERRRLSRTSLKYEGIMSALERQVEDAEFSDSIENPLSTAYFPAFRTMIDAWVSIPEEKERFRSRAWSDRATYFARRWFGQFIPPISYPSLLEIEQRLTNEVRNARIAIGQADRKLLSQAFLDIFESLSKGKTENLVAAEDILQDIKSLFDELEDSPLQEDTTLVTRVYAQLRNSIHDLDLAEESEQTAVRVLNVYKEVLEQVVDVQKQSFREIQRYLESVNEFFRGKKLVVDPSVPRFEGRAVGIRFNQSNRIERLRALSSGERQIVTLIYAATHMSGQKVVLIDEPEISLHVDWQRRLLGKMSEQVGERQIIACTHSPSIGADYAKSQMRIELKPTQEHLVAPYEDSSDAMQERLF